MGTNVLKHVFIHIDLYYTEKTPEYLCENYGVILGSKQALKRHLVTKHSEKVMTINVANA